MWVKLSSSITSLQEFCSRSIAYPLRHNMYYLKAQREERWGCKSAPYSAALRRECYVIATWTSGEDTLGRT
jgi:hypothetical protein